MGDAPKGMVIGPERPGQRVRPEDGFKDAQGRIKRQAARLRVFGLAADGPVVRELTADHAAIAWRVHLANRKAAFDRFAGRYESRPEPRNKGCAGAQEDLVIDPGERRIEGPSHAGAVFDGGRFLGREVALGELRTDAQGRLLVLGGKGESASLRPDNPITDFANNDWWYDDTSDGPVAAEVTLPDGRQLTARPARVIVAPPDFAPDIENLRSLYDTIEEVAVGLGHRREEGRVSFRRDIYPLLRRMARYQWVNEEARRGHGPGTAADFLDAGRLALLGGDAGAAPDDPGRPERAAAARRAIFERIRDPGLALDSPEAAAQANARFMPQLAGDGGEPVDGDPRTWMRLLPGQYARLWAWAEGDFEADWDGRPVVPPSWEDIPLQERPHMLTRGALEPCVGGPFYPGIEMTYVCEDPALYAEPFVLDPEIEPGGITKYMALPWQADFYECNTHWWPAQRPDDVVTESAYDAVMADLARRRRTGPTPFEGDALPGLAPPDSPAQAVTWARKRFAQREPWHRGVAESNPIRHHPGAMQGADALTRLWSEMGFVVARPSPAPAAARAGPGATGGAPAWTAEDRTVYVETERDPYAGMNLRALYYYLCNIDRYPEFLPKARWLVDHFLRAAWERQFTEGYPESWRCFEYSEDLYESRMQRINDELIHLGNQYDPADPTWNPHFRTREDFEFSLINFAPFNQNDGAWLHKVTPAGPLDEIQSLLLSIWMDEAGDGKVHQSPCNVYTDLLHSLGIYLPDPRSRAYAFDERFLDSAFYVPVLELAIAQFSQEYLPELIGFTLELEWTVPGVFPIEKLAEYHGVDSHFFRLHIGIDNAADGHGAKAKEAVKLYLARVRQDGGEEAMQRARRRIWNGFLAFGDTGTLGEDLRQALLARQQETPRAAVRRIVEEKARYGKLNHHDRTLGAQKINDWFSDPDGFLDALVAADYIDPGDPDRSRFFELTGFNGPMFKVFKDEELDAWTRWTLWLGTREETGGHGPAHASEPAAPRRASAPADPRHGRDPPGAAGRERGTG